MSSLRSSAATFICSIRARIRNAYSIERCLARCKLIVQFVAHGQEDGLSALMPPICESRRVPLFATYAAAICMSFPSWRSTVKFHCCAYGKRLASFGR